MTEAQRLADRIETENYEAASMIRRLEAEYRDLSERHEVQAQNYMVLTEECEALRKDAERYRWILRNYLSADLTDLALKAGNLDAAIDAAMGNEQPRRDG
jgi:hypothetical protein